MWLAARGRAVARLAGAALVAVLAASLPAKEPSGSKRIDARRPLGAPTVVLTVATEQLFPDQGVVEDTPENHPQTDAAS